MFVRSRRKKKHLQILDSLIQMSLEGKLALSIKVLDVHAL